VTGGTLIREARRRAGITQAELARRTGLQQPAIARWENGRAEPSLSTLERLVAACGLELRLGLGPAEPEAGTGLQTLSPEERLDQLVRTVRFIEEGRRALARTRG